MQVFIKFIPFEIFLHFYTLTLDDHQFSPSSDALTLTLFIKEYTHDVTVLAVFSNVNCLTASDGG